MAEPYRSTPPMSTHQSEWQTYVAHELEIALPVLTEAGFVLDRTQPHIGGERYLMQAVTTTAGPKVTLLGERTSDQKRVVIKITTNPKGAEEIEHERTCRAALSEINFAYQSFYAPEEVWHYRKNGLTIAIQEFIEQRSTFLARDLKEQFALALSGFKIQEGAHATTYGHLKRIGKIFPIWSARDYLATAEGFNPDSDARTFLKKYERTIEQYSGFLTHTDFVPHNIRVRDGKLYLLDHSALRFGNKYEGWARFINFMVLYNPPLGDALIAYVRLNRTPEETDALRALRVFRLTEILAYYRSTLPRSEGNLLALNNARITFWSKVLESVLNDSPLDDRVRTEYQTLRDSLRSEDEKLRQKELH